MSTKTRKSFNGSSMGICKMKGIATIGIIVVISAAALIVGIFSDRYLGADNFIEQSAEVVLDDIAEKELNLPNGSVNIDLSPSSKETKK